MLRTLLYPIGHAIRYYQGHVRKVMLGPNVSALLVDTKRGAMLVDAEDMGVGRSLTRYGEYGERELSLIDSLTDETSSVLFVGSHVGALAIPVSEGVRSVTAIEANPNTFRLLSANIAIRRRGNLQAIQLAANDKKAKLQFVLNRTNSGGSKRMPVERLRRYFYDRPAVVTVDGDRLDDVLQDNFDVIVMDLEGSEYFALNGMPRLLSRARHLVVEFLPHHLESVAGVSVADFVATIDPFFDLLHIPSLGLRVERNSFVAELTKMFERGESDDGIVFSKQ